MTLQCRVSEMRKILSVIIALSLLISLMPRSTFPAVQASTSTGVVIIKDGDWYIIYNEYYKVRINDGSDYLVPGGYVKDAYVKLANGEWSSDLCYSGYNYGWHVPEFQTGKYWLPGLWSSMAFEVIYNSSELVICQARYSKEWAVNFTYAFFAGKPYYYVCVDRMYKSEGTKSNTQTFWTITPGWVSDCYIFDYETGQVKNIESGTYYMQEPLSQNKTLYIPFWASYSAIDNATIASIFLSFSDNLEKTVAFFLAKNSAYPNGNTEWQLNYWDASDSQERRQNAYEIYRTELLQYIYQGNITRVLEDAKTLKSKQFSDSVPTNVFSISYWRGFKRSRHGINAWSPFLSLGGQEPREVNSYASLQGSKKCLFNWIAYGKSDTWSQELDPNSSTEAVGETETDDYGQAYAKWWHDGLFWTEYVTQYVDSDKMIFNAIATLNQTKALTQIYLNLTGTSNLDDLVQISPSLYDARFYDPLAGWVGVTISVINGTCQLNDKTLLIYALNDVEREYPAGTSWTLEIVFWSHKGNVTAPEQVTRLHERENLQFNDAWVDFSKSGRFGFESFLKDSWKILILPDGLYAIDDNYAIFPVYVNAAASLDLYCASEPTSILWKGNPMSFTYNDSTSILTLTLSSTGFGYLVIQFNGRNGPGLCPTDLSFNQTWMPPGNLTLSLTDAVNKNIKIYCGNFGKPSEIQGGQLLGYDPDTETATVIIKSDKVTVIWAPQPPINFFACGIIIAVAGGSFAYWLYRKKAS